MQLSDQPGPPPKPKSNDNTPTPRNRIAEDVIMALRLYSRLPTGHAPHLKPDLSRIAMGLPFTSVVIGIGPAALLAVGTWLGLPAMFAAALAVAASVLVCGAMAEDALADAADGLFGGHTPERRLEIMKDSRHGTYGVAALCLFLVLRVVGLGTVAAVNPWAAAAIWLAAGIVARSGALWVSLALPHARPDGVAASAGRVGRTAFIIGCVFAAVLGFVLSAPFAGFVGVILAALFAIGTALGWGALCKRLVGGQTGDLIGAAQALIEIAGLTGLLMFA